MKNKIEVKILQFGFCLPLSEVVIWLFISYIVDIHNTLAVLHMLTYIYFACMQIMHTFEMQVIYSIFSGTPDSSTFWQNIVAHLMYCREMLASERIFILIKHVPSLFSEIEHWYTKQQAPLAFSNIYFSASYTFSSWI